MIIACIKDRFDQPRFEVYKDLEDLLLKTVNKDDYEAELLNVIEFYGSDFYRPLLETQLAVVSSNFNAENASIMDTMGHLEHVTSSKVFIVPGIPAGQINFSHASHKCSCKRPGTGCKQPGLLDLTTSKLLPMPQPMTMRLVGVAERWQRAPSRA